MKVGLLPDIDVRIITILAPILQVVVTINWAVLQFQTLSMADRPLQVSPADFEQIQGCLARVIRAARGGLTNCYDWATTLRERGDHFGVHGTNCEDQMDQWRRVLYFLEGCNGVSQAMMTDRLGL